MKILLVCLGNICRSPLAEGILKNKCSKAGLNWHIDSAGTNGFHNGEAPHPLSQKVALANGINIQQQISRKITTKDIEQNDVIFALANDVLLDIKRITGNKFNSQKIKLLMNESEPNSNKDVPDPWYGAEDGYHEVFALIDTACEAIVKNYSTFKN
jgi:protein-tyrosine phosphatase